MNLRIVVLSSLLLLAEHEAARASMLYTVTLDTTSLAASLAGPFTLDVQLNEGGDSGNNTAMLSAFSFAGGAPLGIPELAGGAVGSLLSGITITDSSFLNEFRQSFNAGSTLLFTLFLTGNADSGGTPDEFSVALLDSNGVELPTVSALLYGTSVILLADLIGDGTQLTPFASDPAAPILFAAPVLSTPVGNGVPEPAPWMLLASGFASILLTKPNHLKKQAALSSGPRR